MWPRLVAGALLALFVVVVGFAHRTVEGPGFVGFAVEPCARGQCVSWVLPAGHAWHDGALIGMAVLSIDGKDAFQISDWERALPVAQSARMAGPDGRIVDVLVTPGPMSSVGTRTALWTVAAVFVALGSLVLLRRPDLPAARLFVAFAAFNSLALAVGPAAGGPHATWAVWVVFVTLAGIGATWLPLSVAIGGRWERRSLAVAGGAGVMLVAAHAWVLLSDSAAYQPVRSVLGLYLLVSIVGGLVTLVLGSLRAESEQVRWQAGLCIGGIALGTLPFLTLTLVPVVLGRHPLVPDYVSILFWGIVPLAFVLAILQYELLGIRRLVHRGMVYGLTSIGLLVVVAVLVSLMGYSESERPGRVAVVGLVLVGGLTFHFLLPVARKTIDRWFFGDSVDYGTLVRAVRRDLATAGTTQDVIHAIIGQIVRLFRLEAALLFLGRHPSEAKLVACVGDRDIEVLTKAYPDLRERLLRLADDSTLALSWESDSLLATRLVSSGQYLGHVLWGPKARGEVFLADEKELLSIIPPILALVLEKSSLSDELRDLNNRLVSAQELERRRVASDLHDGPLQKALLLGGGVGTPLVEPAVLARQLVQEIREVCARLRPAILDDLGLVPALQWLLDELSQRSTLTHRLTIHHMGDDDRLPPEVELALFRVVQEAANNAVKHAAATALEVSLTREHQGLTLIVRDDGKGFVPAKTTQGLGLAGMRERVLQLHGSIHVQSALGRGTLLTARVPLA